MMRTARFVALILWLMTTPPGVFVLFTSPGMGYPKSTMGVFAGILAAIGIGLIPVALKSGDGQMTKKAGWGVLIGFLAVMLGFVAYHVLPSSWS